MIIARFDHATRRYVVAAEGDRSSMSFAHPFAAANVGIIVAGELPTDEAKPVPSVFVQPVPGSSTMKTMRIVIAALSLAFVAACDTIPDLPDPSTSGDIEAGTGESSTGEDSSSGSSSTGGEECVGYGSACASDIECDGGLMCARQPGDELGVCVSGCSDLGTCLASDSCDPRSPGGVCGADANGTLVCWPAECDDKVRCPGVLACIDGVCRI